MDKILSGYVMGLPGVHAMFAGADLHFERTLRAGDRLPGTATLKELIERPSRFAGRSFQQIYRVDFHDDEGALVASGDSYCFRTERDTARERGKYEAFEVQWTPEQIQEIAEKYRQEFARRRGAEPRYIEDVKVGDVVPEITKGPYTATTAIAHLMGWGGLYVRAHGDAFGGRRARGEGGDEHPQAIGVVRVEGLRTRRPGRLPTNALTIAPRKGSGAAMTAASRTAECCTSVRSTSSGSQCGRDARQDRPTIPTRGRGPHELNASAES